MAAQNLGESISGGMVGLLIGDAVGVPYEFKSASELPPMELIDIVPPAGFQRSHPNAPKAAWSDDGAQAMCLLASLLEKKGLDTDDFGRRLLSWLDSGSMAVGRVVFDVGNQTRKALSASHTTPCSAPPTRLSADWNPLENSNPRTSSRRLGVQLHTMSRPWMGIGAPPASATMARLLAQT